MAHAIGWWPEATHHLGPENVLFLALFSAKAAIPFPAILGRSGGYELEAALSTEVTKRTAARASMRRGRGASATSRYICAISRK